MNSYTARQAIFNHQNKVVAYELLFRDGLENSFPNIDPHVATAKIITQTHLNNGLNEITGNRRAFINFTEKCLLSGLPEMLPPKEVVIEILETVRPTDEVFERCQALAKAGYTLALDDFIYEKEWNRFFSLVKIVKFDISKTPLHTIKKLVLSLQKIKRIKLLAERVETQEEYQEACEMGFHYFQGFFFQKPQIKENKDIDANEGILVEVFKELAKPILDMDAVTNCFQQDAGLTYKLLRYINSGILPITQKISSIKGALVYLGESRVRDLLRLLTTSLVAKDLSPELLNMTIIRARTCELIAHKKAPSLTEEAFLTGLLSLIDKILDKPIELILEKLSVSDEIVEALTKPKSQNILAIALRMTKYYEAGHWHYTVKECMKLNLEYDLLSDYFKEAIVWANKFEETILK